MRLGALLAVGLALVGPAQAREILGAEYTSPTSAYPHGVLGDDEEWAAVRVTVGRETGTEGGFFQGSFSLTYRIDAPEDMVFEDVAPRLWDITGDGSPEVVVVVSHQNYGAQLAVIDLVDGELTWIAATPMIGTRFRWLAPIGAADLDGDGHIEIAYIDRPHLAKTLRVWRYTPDEFAEIATLQGLTNHRIGEDFITGGIRECGSGPELITADAGWRNIMATRLTSTTITATPVAPFEGPASVERVLACD